MRIIKIKRLVDSMSQRSTSETVSPLEPNISTTEQVNAQETKVINGMKFVSIKNETKRYYDVPGRQRGSTVRVIIENPQWLFVRPSGSHLVVDSEGGTHYIPNDFVHLVWMKKEGTDAAEF